MSPVAVSGVSDCHVKNLDRVLIGVANGERLDMLQPQDIKPCEPQQLTAALDACRPATFEVFIPCKSLKVMTYLTFGRSSVVVDLCTSIARQADSLTAVHRKV